MSLLDDFEENTGVFKGHENRIDQEAFNKLVDEHGEEFASGYLKAMQEFTTQISEILYIPPGDRKGRRRQTPSVVYGMVAHFYNALFKFTEENDLCPDQSRETFKPYSRVKGWSLWRKDGAA